MRIKQTALMWLVAIVVLVGGDSMQAESFSGTGQVYISPATKHVQLNETFDLYIAIDAQVKYFRGFEYNIEVDTNVIRLITAAREPFFTGPEGIYFTWKDTVYTFPQIGSRYVYEMVGSIFGYGNYVDGPGQVVKMTFKAVGNGVSDVIFRKAYMEDRYGNPMSIQDSPSGLVVVCPTANQPPVANAGRDSTLFQCTPAAISIVAGCTDLDGNLSTCLLTSSTGTYSGGHITFTPTGSGTYTFILKATDVCGLTDYDTSVVNATANQAPVANAGRDSTLSQSTPAPISIAAGCTDPDVNPAGSLSTCLLTSGPGDYSGGHITFTPTGIGTYTFILKATDVCGLTDYDTSVVNVTSSYHCGDANGDGSVDISDVVYLIALIFSGGTAPNPLLAGDANCDGGVDISDVVYLIALIFSGGLAPCGLSCIH